MARRYWLMKTEPGCYSIDDLAAQPGQTDHWDGVRNYQARNLLRDEIKKGDGVLLYHSSARPTGIAGLCRVVRSGYPDHTAWDPEAQHFDPKASPENPIWYMVDIKLETRLAEIIPLTRLREIPGLEGMELLRRGSRLSVQPVTSAEWKVITGLAKQYR